MKLRAIRIDFANAISSQVVFLDDKENRKLQAAWDKKKGRIAVECRHSQEDREVHTKRLDLNGVVLIEDLSGSRA
jgi:hypothetical protein